MSLPGRGVLPQLLPREEFQRPAGGAIFLPGRRRQLLQDHGIDGQSRRRRAISGRCGPTPKRSTSPRRPFEVGGYKVLREGKDLVFVSAGYMVHECLKAADELAKSGKKAGVIDAYGLPLKDNGILDIAAKSGGRIITVEDNYTGGLDAELADADRRDRRGREAQGAVCAPHSQERPRAAGSAGLFAISASRRLSRRCEYEVSADVPFALHSGQRIGGELLGCAIRRAVDSD